MEYLKERRRDIAWHRFKGEDLQTMHTDNEYSINFQQAMFFCSDYIFGASIDSFLSLSVRQKVTYVDAKGMMMLLCRA